MRNKNTDYYLALEKYSSLSRRDIMIRLAVILQQQDSLTLGPSTIKTHLDISKKYLIQNYAWMKDIICASKEKIMTKKHAAAASILDLIIGQCGGMPAVFVALYIVDYGVDKFCNQEKLSIPEKYL
jgi:hypothetical protein